MRWDLALLLLLLSYRSVSGSWQSIVNPLNSVWSTLYPSEEPPKSDIATTGNREDCSDCMRNRHLAATSSNIDRDPIMTELRVEYVKQQILKKLRLSKPPDVSISISTLPKPLINGHVLELRPGAPLEPEKQAESFYGKTDQIVVFPNEGIADMKHCRQSSNHLAGFNPAACFTFYLPKEILFVDVTSAELWFYKESDENDIFNQTFVLSELDHWDKGESFEKNAIMGIFETSMSEGWVNTDVRFSMRKWVQGGGLNHAIQIACSSCSIDRQTAPVSIEMTLKPFLVIHTSPLPQKNRPKRNSNCLPEMKECCRDDLYISFEDIGWSDWILHPSGYHAYFCRGSCSSAASLTMSGSSYNNVIRLCDDTDADGWAAEVRLEDFYNVLHMDVPVTGDLHGIQSVNYHRKGLILESRLLTKKGGVQHRKSEIVPCCSPTQLSPIQLLYVDSNNTITQKTLPNMVVEACGCM